MKKTTISIGIPAYNEEVNIKQLLMSVFKQKTRNYELKKIIVYSDASTDKTNDIVKLITKQNSKITLIKGRTRKGKYYRVNQLFKRCQEDLLIILDADIKLVGNLFIEKLVNYYIKNPDSSLIAAHQIAIRPSTFVGKIIFTSFYFWDMVRLNIPNYYSPHNYFGSATAYSGTFVRSTKIPQDLKDPHLFIFLAAIKTGKFTYCRESEIMQWSISTIDDLKKFINRSLGKKDEKLEKIFGINIETIYSIKLKHKIIGIIKTFIKYPLYTPLALLLGLYMNTQAKHIIADKSPIWSIVTSTKKPFSVSKK